MDCKVIIPSRKRSHLITTEVENAVLVVDKDEFEDYRSVTDMEIVCHEKKRNLSSIRNLILDFFGDSFMVDDDIVSVERLYTTEAQRMNPQEIYDLIQETYYTSKCIGSKLFGFNNDPSPTHYNSHKPFMFNGYINGCAIGLTGDSLRFDERTTACESHYINLLNAYHNRYCFIDKRFHFRQKLDSTFILQGGQSGKRTLESEKDDTLILRKLFGESVVIKREKNETKQLHKYQRQLNIKI